MDCKTSIRYFLYERILVSPLNSEAIVKQLTQFVQLCKTIQPKSVICLSVGY